MENLRQNWY